MNSAKTLAAGAAAALLLAGAAPAMAGTVPMDDPEEVFVFLTAEEKLARDVYQTLGDQYSARQFDRIAASEQQHLEAMRSVLDDQGWQDPTVGDAVGEFDDPAIQAMYDDLVEQGTQSLAEAAAVGIAIETEDIGNLTDALELAPDDAATAVLQAQIAASERHLAAFERLAGIADGDSTAGAGRGGPGNRAGSGMGQRGGPAKAGPSGSDGSGQQQRTSRGMC